MQLLLWRVGAGDNSKRIICYILTNTMAKASIHLSYLIKWVICLLAAGTRIGASTGRQRSQLLHT